MKMDTYGRRRRALNGFNQLILDNISLDTADELVCFT